eukprot:Em0022g47a
MSNKAESRVLLEKYEHLLNKTILVYQNPATGLLPAFVLKDGTAGWASNHAWVRDNVYSVVSVWGLALAYRNIAEREDDKMKAFHLEQSVVKLMRGLLFCMMRQDYGIWERGDKSNHGETELNATSIGMAKAALDAISGLDLFGARGGPSSIICVMYDKLAQCNAKLESLLPRESSSKEVDAGLLSIIGFPAFAVENASLIHKTKHKIVEKLLGEYGCKRFLRDGYQTVREDPHRLHYEYYELKVFENIECEWPLFVIYLVINAVFDGNLEEVERYHSMLERLVIKGQNDLIYVPELYLVPEDKVPLEYKTPHSQPRVPSAKVQHMWAQSLYILCGLLRDKLIAPGEIDPLNRRLGMLPRHDPIVQGVPCVNMSLSPWWCSVPTCCVQFLDHEAFYLCLDNSLLVDLIRTDIAYLKTNWKLVGRPTIVLPILRYGLCGNGTILMPISGMDVWEWDHSNAHSQVWVCGNGTILMPILRHGCMEKYETIMSSATEINSHYAVKTMLGDWATIDKSPVYRLLHTLSSGYTAGTSIQVGSLSDFIPTSCITKLDFLDTKVASKKCRHCMGWAPLYGLGIWSLYGLDTPVGSGHCMGWAPVGSGHTVWAGHPCGVWSLYGLGTCGVWTRYGLSTCTIFEIPQMELAHPNRASILIMPDNFMQARAGPRRYNTVDRLSLTHAVVAGPPSCTVRSKHECAG